MVKKDNGKIYESAMQAMQAKKDSITLLIGPPGTGKTRSAIEAALGKGLNIAVFRPPVSFGKGLGFLPGELENKIDPWISNIKNILIDLGRSPEVLIKEGTLSFPSFEHAQGDTWHSTFVILDECENCTIKELYVIMTRIGQKSRMALCGDFAQTSELQRNSGLPKLTAMMKAKRKTMTVIDFTDAKCYRSDLCGDVTDMFNDENLLTK